MGKNREKKKERAENKRSNYNNKHNSKYVRAKQALLTKGMAKKQSSKDETKGQSPKESR